MNRTPQLAAFLNAFSVSLFGVSYNECIETQTCIKCRKSVKEEILVYSTEDLAEYDRSALCPTCYIELENMNE